VNTISDELDDEEKNLEGIEVQILGWIT